eukprot:1006074-Alexandrium_andersonii.AAC.1
MYPSARYRAVLQALLRCSESATEALMPQAGDDLEAPLACSVGGGTSGLDADVLEHCSGALPVAMHMASCYCREY